ncbi:MAG: hypothetical protein FWD05_13630 [Oscillospiraceae bacterium]|nr:hypothetical protein [Oscillospiraceae bacterium]
MKNNKITNAYDDIIPNDYAKRRVWNKMTTEKQRRTSILPKFATVAAVLAIMIAAHLVFSSSADNSFTVQAFTLGQHEDGRVELVEFDFSTSEIQTSIFYYGAYMYMPIYLDVSGENIANVEFSVTSGFFARQYKDYDNVMLSIATFSRGNIILSGEFCEYEFEDAYPLMFDTEIETLSNRITLEDILVDDYLLLLAIPINARNVFMDWNPERGILIDVVATFNDGDVKSDVIELYFHNTGLSATFHHDIGHLGDYSLTFHMNLDNATLIPESVQVLPKYEDPHDEWGVDVYVWERENGTIYASSHIFRNPGDEERYSLIKVGDDVVLSLIRVDDNGDLVGMEYIIPGEIIMRQDYRTGPYYIFRTGDPNMWQTWQTWPLPIIVYNPWLCSRVTIIEEIQG